MHAGGVAGSLLSVYHWSTVQTEYKNNAWKRKSIHYVNLLKSPENVLHEVIWKLRA